MSPEEAVRGARPRREVYAQLGGKSRPPSGPGSTSRSWRRPSAVSRRATESGSRPTNRSTAGLSALRRGRPAPLRRGRL